MPDPREGRQLGLFDALPSVPGATSDPSDAGRLDLPQLGPGSSLAGALTGFDAHLLRLAKTENTRRAFASDLRLLAEHLGASTELGRIRTEDLNRFLSWLLEGRGRPCSPKSLARRITTLKVFFAWLAESGALPTDPAAGLVQRSVRAPLPRILTDVEVQGLLASAERLRLGEAGRPPDPRPALLVRLLLDTGLKKGELSRLRVDDLALDARPPSLLVRYDAPRFSAKERRLTFGPAVEPLLVEYLARYLPGERLFGCTARNLEYVLSELLRLAGLPVDDIGFETLRWTAALRVWRAAVEPEALREMLGLSPISWVDTRRRLELLADTAGLASVGRYFDTP